MKTLTGAGEDYRGNELVATAYAHGYNRWIMRYLRPHLGRRIVEVGAGTGSYTRELLRTDPEQVIAIEPSGFLFPALQRSLGGDARVELHHGTLADVPGLGGADSVVYVNVLEHIADDAAELRAAARVLRPGGRLAVFVPALPWLNSAFDRELGHHRRYRREELVQLLRGSGLRVIEARYFDMLGIAIWFVAMRLLGMRMGVGRVRTYDTLVVPLARLLDAITGPPIGKSLIVIGQRAE